MTIGILPLIMSILIFSTNVIVMSIVLWLKTNQLYTPDIIRLTCAIICLISSVILLIFKNKFEVTYNKFTEIFSQYTGVSLHVIVLSLFDYFWCLLLLK